MINSVKARTPILALILFVFGIGNAFAENKVVVIPMGADDTTLSTTASISIPVTALLNSGGVPLPFNSTIQTILIENSTSSFGTTFVVPDDYVSGTYIYVDIYVYNPLDNGACQAIIRKNYARRYRAGSAIDKGAEFGYAPELPPFGLGNTTIKHTFRFGSDNLAGDALAFGLFRHGTLTSDNCGEVGLTGLNIRYQRK